MLCELVKVVENGELKTTAFQLRCCCFVKVLFLPIVNKVANCHFVLIESTFLSEKLALEVLVLVKFVLTL
jgi:hypothetical protein